MGYKIERILALGWVICIMMIYSTSAWAATGAVRPFQLTGYEGKLSYRHFSDEQITTGNVNNVDSSIDEFELDVQTRSYIYHPNFLVLDVGGGPVFTRNVSQGETEAISYNFNTRLSFLEKKPYPFSLYYDRRNPLVVSSVSERFLQENTKYGAVFNLRNRKLPVSVNAEIFKLASKGQGNTLIVDEELDSVNLRFFQNNKASGHRQLLLQSNTQQNNSGNIGTNQGSNVDVTSANYDSYTALGKKHEFIFRDTFTYVNRDIVYDSSLLQAASLKQYQYSPNLQWKHSDTLDTFYRLDLFTSDQIGVSTDKNSAFVSYTKQKKAWGSHSANVKISQEKSTGNSLDSYGVAGFLDYSKPFGKKTRAIFEADSKKKKPDQYIGKINFQVSLGFQTFDHAVSNQSDRIQVSDEPHTFVPPSVDITLNQRFVINGLGDSIEDTIEVRGDNLIGTPTLFTIGTDYLLSEVKGVTTITRRVGGSIPDNGLVAVSYFYQSSGTFTNTKFLQQYQASIDLYNKLNIFVGVSRDEVNVTSGISLLDLSSVEKRNFGIIYDTPINDSLSVGADARIDDEVESLAPNLRQSFGGYIQLRFMASALLRISAQKLTVDYENELTDIDLSRVNISFSARPYRGSSIVLSALSEEDIGGNFPRTVTDFNLKFQWRIRKLFFSMIARHNLDTQTAEGVETTIERNFLRATLERRF